MEAQLLFFSKNNDIVNLKNYVQGLNIDKICSELRKICLEEDASVILQILFKGFSNEYKCQEKRTKILEEALKTIQNKPSSSRLSSKIISVLCTEVENLSTSNLITLTNSCLQMMLNEKNGERSACWKDLLPKLLNIVTEKEIVEHEGTRMTGAEYKSEIVTAICVNDWPDHMVVDIACMFIDVPVSPEEHLKVVKKLCRFIKKVKLEEIPPLVHQILQLTKEKNSMLLFISLAEFFDSNLYGNISGNGDIFIIPEDEMSLKDLQIIEGTVLYHISNALSSGPQSVKDFLKTFTNCLYLPNFVLRPFFVTLLLSVSRVSYSFEQEVLNIFKSAFLRGLAEEEKVSSSAWLDFVLPVTVNMQRVLDKVTENCFRDRDRILKSLVNLAFFLLEIVKTRGKDAQCDNIWKIGSTLLLNLIKKYPHITDTVFRNLVNQISQTNEATQYTDSLTKIASARPLSLLDCSLTILQLLENICARLPGVVGQRVIAAILPLTKMSSSFRDSLIIFLRKALFSDQSSREMAVYGFLELLKDLKISDIKSLSQSMSQNYVGITQLYSGSCTNTGGTTSNEGVCLEILSILKQVFDYHYEVKMVLYRGVYDCFYSNPKLGVYILDNLKSRLDIFCKGANETPPLDFQNVVVQKSSSVVVQEPIAYLVFSIAQIVAKSDKDSEKNCNKFMELLDSLVERMSESDIPHFGFDKECGMNCVDKLDHQLKQEKIRQILGVYEALIGYVLCTWKRDSAEYGRKLNCLFKGYCRLSEYAKSAGKAEKKKGNERKISQKEQSEEPGEKDRAKLIAFKFPSTVLNLKCAGRLLAILNGVPVSWASDESVELIKRKGDLHRYAFNVTLELISETRILSPSELSRRKYMLQYVTYVGRILFVKCVLKLTNLKGFESQCAVLALECFSELLHLVCIHFKSKLSSFFTDIGASGDDLQTQLKTIIDAILEQLKNILNEEVDENEAKEETTSKKLSLLLISISSFLINDLTRVGPHLQQVFHKIKTLCKETKVQNPTVAKAILSLFLNIYFKFKPCISFLGDVVLCLCDSMPLIDDEIEIAKHEEYSVINQKTANSCLLAVCEAIHFLAGEIEWMISRFKAELSILSFPMKEAEEIRQKSLEDNERELCRHLNLIVKILSMVCTIAVPPGTFADSVLKEVANIYAKLALVTKYFIIKVTKHRQPLQHTRFEKTIKLADHELTKNMYCFTEHVIADGTSNSEEPALKKQKKDMSAFRNKVLKETKIIPKVIYEKEQFQKFVLQLSLKAKMELEMKHTMARDYRLYAKQVKEIIEKENMHTEEEEMNLDELDNSKSSQMSKRIKIQE